MERRKPRRLRSAHVCLIEQAEALGEPPEDPLLLFSVLYGLWVANLVSFNGDVVRELAAQFLALAEKQEATAPRMIAHRLVGTSLLHTRGYSGRASASRSRVRALRPCRASCTGDAFWPRRRGGNLIHGSLCLCGCSAVPRPRRGRRRRAKGCTRDRPRRHVDVRASCDTVYPYPLRELRGSKRTSRRSL